MHGRTPRVAASLLGRADDHNQVLHAPAFFGTPCGCAQALRLAWSSTMDEAHPSYPVHPHMLHVFLCHFLRCSSHIDAHCSCSCARPCPVTAAGTSGFLPTGDPSSPFTQPLFVAEALGVLAAIVAVHEAGHFAAARLQVGAVRSVENGQRLVDRCANGAGHAAFWAARTARLACDCSHILESGLSAAPASPVSCLVLQAARA